MKGRINHLRLALLAILAASSLALAAGCSGLFPSGEPARRPNTISTTTLQKNPRLAEGQRVFMQQCNQCHVGGAAGLGPSLNDKDLPAFAIRFQVRHGLGAMPAFSSRKISNSQLDDVVQYLKYIREHESPYRG